MSVLVTGGAGYIGSHVVRLLQERGDDVVVVDDLSNGIAERVGSSRLAQIDLSSDQAEAELTALMKEEQVASVIHFAAKKQVGESMERPLWYYQNNVVGLTNLLAAMEAAAVTTMVFSSSAGTYGIPDTDFINEKTSCEPINPYGQTKLIGEWMIDNAATFGLKAVKLRYFNVAGAGWPDLRDTAMMNLVPIVYNRLIDGKTPVIFGNDYPTPDGTCIRDYVHVKDLADAHVTALDYAEGGNMTETVFNVGTGQGTSVQEIIDEISTVIGRDLQPEIAPRRPGDPPRLVADASAIARVLDWRASYDLHDMAVSACPPELLPESRKEPTYSEENA